jgi:hypothetical protein
MSGQIRRSLFEGRFLPEAAGSWFPPPVISSQRHPLLELTSLER